MKSRNSPVSGGREDTFYNPASDESFALGQRLQDLFEKASSPRLISIIYKQQNHTQVWVIKQSWKRPQQNTAVSVTKDNTVEYKAKFLLSVCDLTRFFQGCWGNGPLAEMKGFHMGSIHAGEHDGKASLPLLVLLRKAGRATGGHCIEEQ